jgi:RsiW-degrading membrane proteinase PrsW (M82 family)
VRESELTSRPTAAVSRRRLWLWLFVAMLGLLVLSIVVERVTENPKFIPSILALGAFAVPVAFIAFVGSRVPTATVPLGPVAVCFVAGGVVGTAVASVLEWDTLRDLGTVPVILVGGIEEPAKLIVPVAFFLAARYVPTADGLILGVAAGMGFAAFETMGYALSALLQADHIGSAERLLFQRSAAAPFGHPTWTALVCTVLWHERRRLGHAAVTPRVVAALAAAIMLHAGWDAWVDAPVKQTVVGVISATLLVLCVLVARRDLRGLVAEPEYVPGSPVVARLRGGT